MNRLILLATASFLRFIARLPLGTARKLADAADWLECLAEPDPRRELTDGHELTPTGEILHIPKIPHGSEHCAVYTAPPGWGCKAAELIETSAGWIVVVDATAYKELGDRVFQKLGCELERIRLRRGGGRAAK